MVTSLSLSPPRLRPPLLPARRRPPLREQWRSEEAIISMLGAVVIKARWAVVVVVGDGALPGPGLWVGREEGARPGRWSGGERSEVAFRCGGVVCAGGVGWGQEAYAAAWSAWAMGTAKGHV
jgi:hypothetical protein